MNKRQLADIAQIMDMIKIAARCQEKYLQRSDWKTHDEWVEIEKYRTIELFDNYGIQLVTYKYFMEEAQA